ncbi:MAG: tetratricopeptide repeat protein, partial [Rhodospirillales bacterium]
MIVVPRNSLFAVLILLLSGFHGFAAAASSGDDLYDQAAIAYKAQDYDKAADLMERSAEGGFARAMLSYGFMIEKGLGRAQSFSEAARWYRKAADLGNEIARHNLGYFYEKGIGVDKDMAAALTWYRLSADQGYVRAQNNLGHHYLYGTGVEKNHEMA